MKQLLDFQYAKLCQELGDTEFRISQLSKKSEELKKKIQALNEMQPEILSLESMIPKQENDRNKA